MRTTPIEVIDSMQEGTLCRKLEDDERTCMGNTCMDYGCTEYVRTCASDGGGRVHRLWVTSMSKLSNPTDLNGCTEY